MIIAINGELIDTNHIYKISEVYTGHEMVNDQSFSILSFNNEVILIKENPFTNLHMKRELKVSDPWTECDKENMKKYVADKITAMKIFRESIVNIWSNNQSTIPQFNL